MKTLYAACLARLGLSLSEAADIHKVRRDTVNSWSSGRNRVPQGAWDDLRALEQQVADGADRMLEGWEAAGSPPIEINTEEAAGPALMSAADFILNSFGPVYVGETEATRMARQARRPN